MRHLKTFETFNINEKSSFDFVKETTDGILELVSDSASADFQLKEDEYFATMVVGELGHYNSYVRDGHKVNPNMYGGLDVGVECTGGNMFKDGISRPYISKNYDKRKSRGRTIIVKVNDIDKCSIL